MRDDVGRASEWRSKALRRYQRLTNKVEALIAGAYLAGTNTRRVKRAPPCSGAVGKDVVSRTWRKVKTDWEAWNRRDLAAEEVVRLILDGTVVRVRLDRKATNDLAAGRPRRAPRRAEAALAVRNMGGESEAAWRGILDDLIARGLRTPEFLVIDGGAGLERALAALWPDVPAQRCTVHKHRNLLAHAPETLHEEVSADYTDMIYAASAKEVEARAQGVPAQMAAEVPRRWPRAWRRPATACSPSCACPRANGNRRGPPTPSSGCTRSSSAGSRPRPCCPSAETAAMLFWALLASGQITMRKVDGWQTLAQPPPPSRLTSPPEAAHPQPARRSPIWNLHHIRDTT